MIDFIESGQKKARKDRTCLLCGKMIYKGTDYVSVTGRSGGIFFREDYHIHCDALIEAYILSTGIDEFDIDMVNDWIGSACNDCGRISECLEECDTMQECDYVLERCLGRKYIGTVKDSVNETKSARRQNL